MRAEFTNGHSVSRVWISDTGIDARDGELLAAFQYEKDAEIFASQCAHGDKRDGLTGPVYVVACHYSGKVKVYGEIPFTSAS